ncbi:MAG: BON domain-containing protein [Chloroflexota bacterium]
MAPGEYIHFTVAQGWVTLTGQVDRRRRREDAVRMVERAPGVSGVSDLILLADHTPPIEPHMVHQAIEEALHRRVGRAHFPASGAGDPDSIWRRVLKDGTTEQRPILGAASNPPGVQEMTGHPRFQPCA